MSRIYNETNKPILTQEIEMLDNKLYDNAQKAYDPSGLILTLMEMPKKIAEAQNKLNALKQQEDDIKLQIEQVEAEAMLEISDETNGDGKPKYSNDAKRKSALIAKLKDDKDYYQIMIIQLREIQTKINELQTGVYMLKDQFSAAKKLAEMYSAEILICKS